MPDMIDDTPPGSESAKGGSTLEALADIPGLLRGVMDNLLQLGQARIDLVAAELRLEFEQKMRRLLLLIVPICFILTALGLINLGLVAWLAEGVGPVAASFILAGAYSVIGVLWLLWWRASGGMNPPGPSVRSGGGAAGRDADGNSAPGRTGT